MAFSPAAYEWLGRALGRPGAALTPKQMQGSTSSSVFLIESGEQRCVLRVLDNAAMLAEEPDVAAHEAAALAEAREAGLPAPAPLAWAGAEAGFGHPVVLMSWLEGAVDLRPADLRAWLDRLAVQLAAIHRHPAPDLGWSYRSWVNPADLAIPPWSARPALWAAALDLWRGPAPASPAVFIHRDYHPANVLWQAGAISGVVDWINACRGPAGVDVGHCRINLALMYGPEASGQFLDCYRAAAPDFVYEPYWDIDSILDWCLPEPEFYEPWAEFGLERLAPETLRQRLDDYLAQILQG